MNLPKPEIEIFSKSTELKVDRKIGKDPLSKPLKQRYAEWKARRTRERNETTKRLTNFLYVVLAFVFGLIIGLQWIR